MEQLENQSQDSNTKDLQESIALRQESVRSERGSIESRQESMNSEDESTGSGHESINTKHNSSDTNKELVVKQPVVDQDTMNMFASVWVKVEVNEMEDSNISMEIEPDINPFTPDSYKVGNNKTRQYSQPSNKSPKYQCSQCDYTTAYKNCLNFHILGHNGEKPYSCTICEYSTKYPTALSRHIAIKHKTEEELVTAAKVYKCDECDYTSFYKWNLTGHKRKHKNEKQFKCTECEYTTAYRHNFMKHSKKHNDNMVYKCDKCPFVTRFDGHITRHMAKIHNEVSDKASKCDYCDFSTKVNWRLTAHKARSKQEEAIKCSYCDFETYYMCESKRHRKTHFNEANYRNSTQMKDRNESETSQDCDTSQIETEANSELESNEPTQKYTLDPDCIDWNSIEVLESDDKDRPFQCHMCNYTARFKASVQRHFQRHHTGSQNRPYKCVNCDFRTKTKDQIALHNKRSLSKIVFKCDQCKFSTKFKCQFTMHQKSHYENKCPKCGYTCKHKYEMQKHFVALHLGHGLKCQYCDHIATRKENLLSHETIHTGHKPFKCTVKDCEYTSIRKSLLRNHMKRFHSDIQDDVRIISDTRIQSLRLPADLVIQQLDLQNFGPNNVQT